MKILPLLILALVIHTGCASRPHVSGITINKTDAGLVLKNESGNDLNETKMGGWAFYAGQWHGIKDGKFGLWPSGLGVPLTIYGASVVEIDGTCKEGKFEARWSDGSPVPPKYPESFSYRPRYGSWAGDQYFEAP